MGATLPRDLDHFTQLKRWLTLEHAEEQSRQKTARIGLTLGEREARGLTALDLELYEESTGLGGRFLVMLEHADRKPLTVSFHPGDWVELRPRRSEDEAPVSALVTRSTRFRVQVAFEKFPPAFLRDGRLIVDHIPSDVTFERACAAVDAIATMDQGQARRRREVVLGKEPPRFDRPPELKPERPLNPEQTEAVSRALAAQDFFLIHGPPGTGKSTVLSEILVQAVRRGQRVLLTAASNAAVDHLLALALDRGLPALRVGHPARVSPQLQEHTLDLRVEEHPDRVLARELFDEAYDLMGYARRQRTQGRSRERFANARSSQSAARRLMDEARKLERKAVDSILGQARIVASTLSGLPSFLLRDERFDLALVDEATQAIEPLTLLAWLRAERVVLAGDPLQLPPTVLSKAAAGLQLSLFERLLKEHGDDVKSLLREQYRMNAAIMEYPNRATYGGALRAHPSVADRTLHDRLTLASGNLGYPRLPAPPPASEKGVLDVPPVLFLDTAGKGFEDATESEGGSHFNEGEAGLLRAHARALLEAGLAPSELAMITPYRAQVARLRPGFEDTEVEIDTVDAFQGREKDAILISLTRSNSDGQLGFLNDLRRINVAITRARRHLFIVGDSATLSQHPYYSALIDSIQAQGGYRSAWEWPES